MTPNPITALMLLLCAAPLLPAQTAPSAESPIVPGSSELATLAAAMEPGTWAQLTVSDQDATLGVGSISGTTIHYCNSMPWNPLSRVIEIIGMDHGYHSLRHMRFDAAANGFVLVADDAGLGTGHGYDHQAVNPFTGDLYSRLYSGFTGKISTKRKLLGAASFTAIADLPAADQVAIGATWWSGPFVGAGSQGAFLLFNSGNSVGSAHDGEIAAYDPLTGSWFFDHDGMAPFYGSGSTYDSVIEYSAVKNVAVYGGGNVAPDRLWRLDADGSAHAMPNVPAGKAVGIQRGLLCDDPVTGNFLLLSAGELWELDPDGAGTWTKQDGPRTPPAGVGVPGPSPTIVATICSSIAELGVVAYITQPSYAGGTFFLYKHAASTPSGTSGSGGTGGTGSSTGSGSTGGSGGTTSGGTGGSNGGAAGGGSSCGIGSGLAALALLLAWIGSARGRRA